MAQFRSGIYRTNKTYQLCLEIWIVSSLSSCFWKLGADDGEQHKKAGLKHTTVHSISPTVPKDHIFLPVLTKTARSLSNS